MSQELVYELESYREMVLSQVERRSATVEVEDRTPSDFLDEYCQEYEEWLDSLPECER